MVALGGWLLQGAQREGESRMRKKRYVLVTLGLCAASAGLAAFMTYDLARSWPKPAPPQPNTSLRDELASLRAEASGLRKQLAELQADRAREAEERVQPEAAKEAENEAAVELPPPPYPLWNHRNVEEWAGQWIFRFCLASGETPWYDFEEFFVLFFHAGQLHRADLNKFQDIISAFLAHVDEPDKGLYASLFPSTRALRATLDLYQDPSDKCERIALLLTFLPVQSVSPCIREIRALAREQAACESPKNAGALAGALAWACGDAEGFKLLTRHRQDRAFMGGALSYAIWLCTDSSRHFIEQAAISNPVLEIRSEAKGKLESWDEVASFMSGEKQENPEQEASPPQPRSSPDR